MKSRNLFYTRTFVFLSIAFLSGSLPVLDDIQKNGLTILKGGALAISFLSSIGVTIDKMEKEKNVATPSWFPLGRNPDAAQAYVDKNQVLAANQAVQPLEAVANFLSVPEDQRSSAIADVIADTIAPIDGSNLQLSVSGVKKIAIRSILSRFLR
jgi:hypothetical protein